MTRKLLAVLVTLLLTAGLFIASASAGAYERTVGAQGSIVLQAIPRVQVPFIANLSRVPRVVKSVRPAFPASAARPVRTQKTDAGLAAKVASAPAAERFDVMVMTSTEPEAITAQLAGAEVTQTYRLALKGFAASLTAAQIRQLQANPNVVAINPDKAVHATIDSATKWTGVTTARTRYALTGDNDGWPRRYSTDDIVIAMVDTGIDVNHKDLAGKVVGWQDFVNGESEPYDDNGHGTHVSGIAAGSGAANASMKGVAPGAALVGVKVLDQNGAGTFSGVIAGIEWVMENQEAYNIRILSLSLGSSEPSDGRDELSMAVNAAAEAGIVTVVAGGNRGPDYYTIGSPAAAEQAITVCAMRDAGKLGWSLEPFSSRGPTTDGRIKPDICAPGAEIAGPRAGTTRQYVRWSGTSMATPFVAGVAALLLEANPYLSVEQVKQALFSTAQDWGDPGWDPDYGYGRIDALKAVQSVMGLTGSDVTGPFHAGGAAVMADAEESWFAADVTDTSKPIAVTLLLTDAMDRYYDLDLYLYDEAGNQLAASESLNRQETINYRPVKRGKYYLQVKAYEGGGSYTLDASWR